MTRDDAEQELRAFLGSLGSSAGDVGDQSDRFHETFMNIDPNAVSLVTRDQLRAALPMRARMFGSIGATGTRLTDASVTPLDDLHALARATWDVLFEDPQSPPLQLRSSFLLRRADGKWEVLVYLNHQDIARIVAERASQASGG